jgi:hypothetical protein
MPSHDPFFSIAASDLDHVSGGAARVSSRSGANSDQLTQMLNQITSSIKDLAGQKSSGMDPMMMMMMMMMMGGGGGGGSSGAAAAAAPPPAPAPTPTPAINISVRTA